MVSFLPLKRFLQKPNWTFIKLTFLRSMKRYFKNLKNRIQKYFPKFGFSANWFRFFFFLFFFWIFFISWHNLLRIAIIYYYSFFFSKFAPVVLAWQKTLKVPLEKINIDGGAIALGHPLGASVSGWGLLGFVGVCWGLLGLLREIIYRMRISFVKLVLLYCVYIYIEAFV